MKTRQIHNMLVSFILAVTSFPASAFAAPPEPSDDFSVYFRMIWGLCIVLGIILILFTLLKKRFNVFQSRSGDAINVLEIKPIMPKKSLCLVEVRGEEYLLGIGSEEITCLAQLSKGNTETFREVLEQSAKETA